MALEFDNRISLGHVMTVGMLAVTVALAWGDVKNRTEYLSERLTASTTVIAAHENRISAMERNAARQDERMTLVLDILRKIEAKLERLETQP